MAEEKATVREKSEANPSKAASKLLKLEANALREDGDANAAATRQRKKRKWDQPAEAMLSAMVSVPAILPFGGVVPLPGVPISGIYPSLGIGLSSVATQLVAAPISPAVSIAQQSAAAIVHKINQDLVNKGLIPQAKIQDEVIAKEIVINDAEPGIRYKLTKRQTQEEIQMKTGSVVITRGKYKPPNAPIDHEKPLYLHISAGAHLKRTAERVKAVDQAAALVEEMLKQGRQLQGHCPSAAQLSSSMMNPPFTAPVFLGLKADSSLDIASRIRGPNDQYINHIMNETGATVVLKGRVSNNLEGTTGEELQPLHLFISSDNPKSLDDARRLAENLMETIRSEFLGSKLAPYSPGAFYNLQQSLPGYQVPSYAAASVVPGSSCSYYSYSLSQLSSQLPSGGSLTQLTAAAATTRWSSTKSYSAVPPPKQLLTPDQQSSGNNPLSECGQSGEDVKPDTATSPDGESHSTSCSSLSIPPSTVVPALPAVATNTPSFGISYASHPALSDVTAVCPPQTFSPLGLGYGKAVTGSYPQAAQLQSAQSIAAPVAVTGYSGYSEIYPQATPLQQVALALQRPPPPVSAKPISAVLESTGLKQDQRSSIQGHSEKPVRQRRKFQEFPVAVKEHSRTDQVIAGPATVNDNHLFLELSEKQRLVMPPPKNMPPPPPKNMPPPPPKNMPPPPPKNMPPPPPKTMLSQSPKNIVPPPKSTQSLTMDSSSVSTSLLNHLPLSSSRSSVLLPSANEIMLPLPSSLTMPVVSLSKLPFASSEDAGKTGLKFVEYGDDDDDDDDDADEDSDHDSRIPADGKSKASYINGKPFWAV